VFAVASGLGKRLVAAGTRVQSGVDISEPWLRSEDDELKARPPAAKPDEAIRRCRNPWAEQQCGEGQRRLLPFRPELNAGAVTTGVVTHERYRDVWAWSTAPAA
jgi:hypothetical protein